MGKFSSDWLLLREPHDALARNLEVQVTLTNWCVEHDARVVYDLGAGSGANHRYLARHLPNLKWTLFDHDETLLALAEQGARAGDVKTITFDLAKDLPRLDGVDVVTGSALLDLVSDVWLHRLVAASASARCAVLFSLSYDGTTQLSPRHPFDARVLEWVNAHQRGDKGFGPALGPVAGGRAAALWRSAGYSVQTGASDWCIAPSAGDIQRELIDGWASAAREVSPSSAGELAAWQNERLTWVEQGASTVRVGHSDLFAAPPERTGATRQH